MKTPAIVTILCLCIGGTTGFAFAQKSAQDMAGELKDACQKELETYCKTVSLGEGRTFACLYAYSDKLSPRCEYTLYTVAKELEKAVAKLNYVASACSTDLKQYCSGLKAGEGRIANCLKRNQAKTSAACQQAIKDTGPAAK